MKMMMGKGADERREMEVMDEEKLVKEEEGVEEDHHRSVPLQYPLAVEGAPGSGYATHRLYQAKQQLYLNNVIIFLHDIKND